jgi:hypothetical protein
MLPQCFPVPTIRTLMAAGLVSQHELANELNRRGIATARGGNWHRTTVVRMLRRLGLPAAAQAGTATTSSTSATTHHLRPPRVDPSGATINRIERAAQQGLLLCQL